MPTVTVREMAGLILPWSSPPGTARPSSRATSGGASIAASSLPVSPRNTVHGTRKTCASLLAALDVHPRVAMRILRHSKIAVTMEIYTEAPSDATRNALRRLGDWLA
jgi:integrase